MSDHYTFIADPGHAWLKVPHNDVVDAGIAEQISSCSYVDDTHVYLEEDCDAPRFLDALSLSASAIPEEFDEHSVIRDLLPYTPAAITS